MNRNLSRREVQIINALAADRSTAEVALDLHISEHTVRTHVKNAMRKLEVRHRAGAVAKLYEQRLTEAMAVAQ